MAPPGIAHPTSAQATAETAHTWAAGSSCCSAYLLWTLAAVYAHAQAPAQRRQKALHLVNAAAGAAGAADLNQCSEWLWVERAGIHPCYCPALRQPSYANEACFQLLAAAYHQTKPRHRPAMQSVAELQHEVQLAADAAWAVGKKAPGHFAACGQPAVKQG